MKVWLYYRLSRDEDKELNSLTNQRNLIYNYAVANGHTVVGESFDDNISGMHFNRPGIEQIYEIVETGKVEAIIVKDLSRLGRHKTQTALFIDYLREHDVRVLSATENIDTFNENDDLIIGFKGLVNDFYARDGSRRVRTGYRQKQKQGIVITPPFGYFKDKNTKQVVIVEEAAETVRMIYNAYVNGEGFKAIARMLNEQKRKTPARMQLELIGKRLPNTHEKILKKYLWAPEMIGRILRDESYVGTLICHKSERNKINKTFRFTEESEQFRHENFLPPIITQDVWEQAQMLLSQRKKRNVRAGAGQQVLRYSGMLQCQDCGRNFTGKRVKLKDSTYVVYVCDTYQRYGKEHCTSHMVHEEDLDRLLKQELRETKEMYQQNWDALEKFIAQWTPKSETTIRQIEKTKEQILLLEEEVEVILMERIRDSGNRERYDRMIAKREAEISSLRQKIEQLQNIEQVIRQRQSTLKKDIRLMDDILSDGNLSEAQIRLLVDKILVREQNGEIGLEFCIKAPFRDHYDEYESGEITGRWASLDFDYDRLGKIICGDYYEGEG